MITAMIVAIQVTDHLRAVAADLCRRRVGAIQEQTDKIETALKRTHQGTDEDHRQLAECDENLMQS